MASLAKLTYEFVVVLYPVFSQSNDGFFPIFRRRPVRFGTNIKSRLANCSYGRVKFISQSLMRDPLKKGVTRLFEVHLYAPLLTIRSRICILQCIQSQEAPDEPFIPFPPHPGHQLLGRR